MLKFDATMPNTWCSTCQTSTPQALLDTGQYGCAAHNTNPKVYAKKATAPAQIPTQEVGETPAWMLG